jgi:hypothetical protein
MTGILDAGAAPTLPDGLFFERSAAVRSHPLLPRFFRNIFALDFVKKPLHIKDIAA